LTQTRPAVLVIGGTDSSGGAGVTRDLRTLADLQTGAMAAVTAVTAQTHAQVRRIEYIPPDLIADQIATALASNQVKAIKIGMLGTRPAVQAVVASLPSRDEIPIVLDPVLASSSGRALLDDEGRAALIELLLPRVTLLTPNIPEAAALLGEEMEREDKALTSYGTRLLELHGSVAVLVKGGHAEGDEAVDLFVSPSLEVVRLRSARLPGTLRGTGCALASAIAAGLAHQKSLLTACRDAKHYVATLFDEAL
jgi:hydroxymethylpyrimidine/phosphomethylpyrimidine kinase